MRLKSNIQLGGKGTPVLKKVLGLKEKMRRSK